MQVGMRYDWRRRPISHVDRRTSPYLCRVRPAAGLDRGGYGEAWREGFVAAARAHDIMLEIAGGLMRLASGTYG